MKRTATVICFLLLAAYSFHVQVSKQETTYVPNEELSMFQVDCFNEEGQTYPMFYVAAEQQSAFFDETLCDPWYK